MFIVVDAAAGWAYTVAGSPGQKRALIVNDSPGLTI